MNADADDVLDAVTAGATALGLTLGGAPLAFSKRKVPSEQESIDGVPQGVVCKSPRPELVSRWSFAENLHTVFVRIAIVSASKGDMLTGLSDHAAARDRLLDAFASRTASNALASLAGLRDVSARPDDFLPVEKINRGYDYQLVEVAVETTRTRA